MPPSAYRVIAGEPSIFDFNFRFQFQFSIFNFTFQFQFSIAIVNFYFQFLFSISIVNVNPLPYDLNMWPRITWNWTLATINNEPDLYCLPSLARSINHEPDWCCLHLVRSTYHGSHPWWVVLMFSAIPLPRVLHDIVCEELIFNSNF